MDKGVNFEDVLNSLAQNPETMQKLMAIANNVMKKDSEPEPPPIPPESECKNKPLKKNNDISNLIRLLIALQPYLAKDKSEKINGIVKILKLVELGENAGLINNLK